MIDISRSKREMQFPKTESPGPAKYKVRNYLNSQSFSFNRNEKIPNSFKIRYFKDIPGPGAYLKSFEPIKKSSSRFSSDALRFRHKKEEPAPGPGSYSPEMQTKPPEVKVIRTLKVHPSPSPVSIPMQQTYKFNYEDSYVPPKEYKIKSPFRSKSGLDFPSESRSLSVRKQFQPRNAKFVKFREQSNLSPTSNFKSGTFRDCLKPYQLENVGPGYYNATKKSNMRAAYIGSSSCKKPSTLHEMGPGAYNIKLVPRNSYKFAKSNRFSQKNYEEVGVGPGSYDLDWSPSRYKNPISSKSERFKETLPEESPGPGQYDLSAVFQNSVLIGTDLRFKEGPNNYMLPTSDLGPGEYETNASLLKPTFNVTWAEKSN